MHKKERLKSRKQIEQLFGQGHSFGRYPLRIVYALDEAESTPLAQVAFSVPKKRFRKAVDRNLLKRRMRESWRHHKHRLYEELNTGMYIMLIYTGSEALSYHEIDQAIRKIIARLLRDLARSSAKNHPQT